MVVAWARVLLFGLAAVLVVGFSGCGDDDDDVGDGDDDVSDDDADDDADDDDAGDDDTWPPLPDDDDDTGGPEYPEVCADGPVFDFELIGRPLVTPYPNNLYTRKDDASPSGFRVQINENVSRPIGQVSALGWLFDAVNALDGFSTAGDLYVPVWNEPDPQALPDIDAPGAGDSVFVMVADEANPHDGEFAPLRVEWVRRALRMTPWRPLRERTRYLIVATRALAPSGGGCYRASATMREVFAADAGDDAITARYADDLDRLVSMGVAREDVLSIADFTTLDATGGLLAVREKLDELASSEAPVIYDWSLEPRSDSNLAAFAHASLDVPIFQNDDGQWVFVNGVPQVQRWETVPVLLSVPKADAYPGGPPYPVMVYGHGALDRKESLRTGYMSNTYAAEGIAVAGIDAVCHGERGPGDEVAEALCYFDAFRPLSWRDNIRQSVSDYLWLTIALRNLDDVDLLPIGSPDGTPEYDSTRTHYFGHSLGTLHGGPYMALAREVDAGVMALAGARYVTIGLEGPVVEPVREVIEQIEDVLPGVRVVDAAYVIGVLLQNILDAGDPANYLRYTGEETLPGFEGRAPDILHIGAAYDYTLGGQAGAYFGRSGGWPQLTPYVWDADMPHAACPYSGSGFYQYDTDDHLLHYSSDPLGDAVRTQVAHFLRTHLDTGTGEIIDPLAP